MASILQQNLVPIVLMGLLLVCSALFSGTETALFSLTSEHSKRLAQFSHTKFLMTLLAQRPTALLSSILLGNLIVNILFFCAGSVGANQWFAHWGAWGETLGGTILLFAMILLGEIVPKALGVSHPVAVLRLAGGALSLWVRLCRPLSAWIDAVLRRLRLGSAHRSDADPMTVEDLKILLESVRFEPGFGANEKMILEDIMMLSDVRVREVMVPRVQLFSCSCATPRAELLRMAAEGAWSHVLVYGEREDDLLGALTIRDLFFDPSARPLADRVRPLKFVPEVQRADQLLREMRSGGWSAAAVVDEYGGLAGVVTLDHLLAEVVSDEQPGHEGIEQVDENRYRLKGSLSIRSWEDLLKGFLPGQEVRSLAFDTLGGFVVSLLGRVPQCGDEVAVGNLRLVVETMQKRRIETVLLQLNVEEARR